MSNLVVVGCIHWNMLLLLAREWNDPHAKAVLLKLARLHTVKHVTTISPWMEQPARQNSPAETCQAAKWAIRSSTDAGMKGSKVLNLRSGTQRHTVRRHTDRDTQHTADKDVLCTETLLTVTETLNTLTHSCQRLCTDTLLTETHVTWHMCACPRLAVKCNHSKWAVIVSDQPHCERVFRPFHRYS